MWRLALVLAGCGFSVELASDRPIDGGPDGDGNPPVATMFRRSIDIVDARVSGTHTNFPVVVDLAGDWLKSTANGGRVGRVDGGDIAFSTDAAGSAVLTHEVEVYMPVEGRLIAWVKVPTLMPSTVLYIHYGGTTVAATGDPKTVWTAAAYGGVWHLQTNIDASGQNTVFQEMGTQVTNGRIAAARSFDGMNEGFVDVGSASTIDDVFTDGGTAEAWFNAVSGGENGAGRLLEKGGWTITFDTGALRFFYDWTGGDGAWLTPVIALGQWHHVAVVYGLGSTATLYLDGVAATTQVQNPTGTPFDDQAATLHIGNRPAAGARTFHGVIDEVRMSTGARDAGWISTSFQNQRDPSMFYALGEEEAR